MEPNRLGDITAFVFAVKTGSFTAAAVALGLTRSAVGKAVARLESRLGTRLLHRTTRTLSLTDDGRAVYERWRQILEDLDEVEATMAVRRGQPAGTLKLTTPKSFGQRHILPILNHYLKQWPDLHADMRFTDRFVDLVEEGFDIAIHIGALKDDSQLLTRTLAWQQFVTCATPEYLATRGTPQTPKELAGHDIIVFTAGGQPSSWYYQIPDGLHIRQGEGRLNMDSAEAIREAGLAGFGLLYLPTYVVGNDLRAGSLVEVLEPFRAPSDPIRVVYPSKRHLSPRIRAFIDLIAERWQDGVPWEA